MELPEAILYWRRPTQRQHDDQITRVGPVHGGRKRLQFFLVMFDARRVSAASDQLVFDDGKDIAMLAATMLSTELRDNHSIQSDR